MSDDEERGAITPQSMVRAPEFHIDPVKEHTVMTRDGTVIDFWVDWENRQTAYELTLPKPIRHGRHRR